MRWNRVALFLTAVVFAASTPAVATDIQPAHDGQTPVATATGGAAAAAPVIKRIPGTAPSMQGLVVVRDAETGEFRTPNAKEWARLSEHLEPANRFAEGLEELQFPDGTVGVRLDDSFHSFSLVQKDSHGQTHPSCTTSAQAIVNVVTGAAPAPEVRNEQ